MSMFPGAHAQVYKNEEGEVLGWDYPSEPDPYDDYDDGDDYHEHEWGPVEHARFTGNPHRKCTGCDEITLDLNDEEDA